MGLRETGDSTVQRRLAVNTVTESVRPEGFYGCNAKKVLREVRGPCPFVRSGDSGRPAFIRAGARRFISWLSPGWSSVSFACRPTSYFVVCVGSRQTGQAFRAPAGARVTSLYVLAVARRVKRFFRLPPAELPFCSHRKVTQRCDPDLSPARRSRAGTQALAGFG